MIHVHLNSYSHENGAEFIITDDYGKQTFVIVDVLNIQFEDSDIYHMNGVDGPFDFIAKVGPQIQQFMNQLQDERGLFVIGDDENGEGPADDDIGNDDSC